MWTNEDECLAAGVDPEELGRIARNLEKWAAKLADMGLTVFGASGSGDIRLYRSGERPLILAEFDRGNFDGGDGHCMEGEDGLLRGE